MNQAKPGNVRGNNSADRGIRRLSRAFLVLVTLALATVVATAGAQTTDQHKRKVPVIDKLSTGGAGEQAFTGLVKSVNLKGSVLEVTGARDGADEYFPFKKSVHVSTADGKYATLDNVKQGWNVLIYYEEKDNGPSIKEIVLLGPPKPAPAAAPAPEAAKSAPPPS
jgi:hypothetical protein